MKANWNERFNSEDFQYGTSPNDFFKSQIDPLKLGRILIPAAGEGRDAVYAAKLGWDTYAFDHSERGQAKAMKLASQHRVSLHYNCSDALQVRFPIESFDAIMLTYFHLDPESRSQFHAKCIQWLKPGGIIILEGFNKCQLPLQSGGPKNIDWLYDKKTLETDFNELDIILLEEKLRELNEGPLHQGMAEVIQMVAQKQLFI
jgi:2-polyprenyl-3-methyl-5-hydroxy-6-metoxy-1,4-benzoquinol methylase